jgi:hypothetical protein
MKVMIALSLDANEQDRKVTVIDGNGSEQVLHAEGGQCVVELTGAGPHTVTIDTGKHA